MRRHGEVSHRHHLRLSGYEARPEADHFRLPRQAPSRKDQTTYSGWATGRSNGPTVAPTALASLAFASFFARIASISASAAATPDFGWVRRWEREGVSQDIEHELRAEAQVPMS